MQRNGIGVVVEKFIIDSLRGMNHMLPTSSLLKLQIDIAELITMLLNTFYLKYQPIIMHISYMITVELFLGKCDDFENFPEVWATFVYLTFLCNFLSHTYISV